MGTLSGGQLVGRMLKKEGVRCVFTLMGGHNEPMYESCEDEGIRVVDTRHEGTAVHAAEGWAKATRELGVAIVTAGPGVTNVVTGMANALKCGTPILVLAGRAPLKQLDMEPLQELDHAELMRPVSKWSRMVVETARIPEFISMAIRRAFAGRPGPVFLDLPTDIQYPQAGGEIAEHDAVFPENYRTTGRAQGDPELVKRAARLLANAERPIVVAGDMVYWSGAHEELRAFVEAVQAPAYLMGMGRGCLPADHSLFFIFSRSLALREADVVALVGTPIDFRLGYGRPPVFGDNAKVIQVDVDPVAIGHNRPVDVGIVGDTRAVLVQLRDHLEGSKGPSQSDWIDRVRHEEDRVRQARETLMNSDEVPIHPWRLCKELRDFLPPETIVVGDGGDFVSSAAQVLRIHQPGHWLDLGRMGTLGVGPGYAMAARLAHPDQPVLLVSGDGAFGFYGLEFDTMVRHKLPVVAVVGNNGSWSALLPHHRRTARYLGHTRYDRVVEALGGYGEYVEKPEDIRPALERAFAAGVPACVNVRISSAPYPTTTGRHARPLKGALDFWMPQQQLTMTLSDQPTRPGLRGTPPGSR